jgi:hypothetical protein
MEANDGLTQAERSADGIGVIMAPEAFSTVQNG